MAYEEIGKEKRILRDDLAIERTKLAQERTYLSYIRTGMSLMMGGIFFIGYFQTGVFHYIGYLAVVAAIMFFVYGFYNHRKSMDLLDKMMLGMLYKKLIKQR